MKSKRLFAAVFCLILIFSLASCKIEFKKGASDEQESTTLAVSEALTDNLMNTENNVPDGTVTEAYNQETSQSQAIQTTASSQTAMTTNQLLEDPADWSKEKIIEEYKKAATKSNSSAKSTMKIMLVDININNGEYDKAMSFVKPIIAKFIESSSTENDGITGGFHNLVPQDVSSAKAYKNGNNTVIEMTMVEQTSGPKEDANSGSVGHAITAVGDISVVVNDLAEMGLPLELSEKDTKIYYTNPKVVVTINENGEINSGTWSYRVKICMDNMKAFGQTVEKASITMDNTITL